MALMLLPPQKFTRRHHIGIFVIKDCIGGYGCSDRTLAPSMFDENLPVQTLLTRHVRTDTQILCFITKFIDGLGTM